MLPPYDGRIHCFSRHPRPGRREDGGSRRVERDRPLGLRADESQGVDGGDLVALGGLEANGDFRFVLHEGDRERVGHVEELKRTAAGDGLFGDALAVDEDLEGAVLPFVAVVDDDEGEGVVGVGGLRSLWGLADPNDGTAAAVEAGVVGDGEER